MFYIALSVHSLLEAGRIDEAILQLNEYDNANNIIPSSTYHAVIEACRVGGGKIERDFFETQI